MGVSNLLCYDANYDFLSGLLVGGYKGISIIL